MVELNSPPTLSFYILWFYSCYLAVAGGAYLYSRKRFDPQRAREVRNSFISLALYSGLSYLTAVWFGRGWTKIYLNLSDYSLLWYFCSYVVVLALHDTYFYWTHRLMHAVPLFRRLHSVHHQSVNPSPFTAHSFHPLEAIVQGVFFVLISLLIPLHWSTFLVFHLFATIINVYGHLGFSLIGGREKQGVFRLCNHPSTHQWHHRHVDGNYTLYFTIWDFLMKTQRGHINSYDE